MPGKACFLSLSLCALIAVTLPTRAVGAVVTELNGWTERWKSCFEKEILDILSMTEFKDQVSVQRIWKTGKDCSLGLIHPGRGSYYYCLKFEGVDKAGKEVSGDLIGETRDINVEHNSASNASYCYLTRNYTRITHGGAEEPLYREKRPAIFHLRDSKGRTQLIIHSDQSY